MLKKTTKTLITELLIATALLTVMVSCADRTTEATVVAKDGNNGSTCTTQQMTNGAKITCSDGSFSMVYNGTNGENGQDGTNGTSCTVSGNSSGALITCSDGSQTQLLNGANGSSGTSCVTTQLSNGVRITCGTQSAVVYNGQNAATTFGIKGYIYPCGQGEFNNDEVFLRMTDGSILAVYDGGNLLSRLVQLAPGNYITTDRSGTQCTINVDSNLNVNTSPRPATGLNLNQ